MITLNVGYAGVNAVAIGKRDANRIECCGVLIIWRRRS